MRKAGEEFRPEMLRGRVDSFVKKLRELLSDATDEAVHDARVESRRMRAALEAFHEMFPWRPFDSAYKSVRRITQILGGPRETAVSLDLVRDLERSRAAEPFCLEYLHKRLASKLKKREARLRKGLERVDPLRLQSRLEFLLSVMEPASWPDHPHQPPLFPMREGALEQAQTVLTSLTAPISGFRTLERFKAATDLELHSLRIAAKKSRYAMEMFSSIWPGGLSASIERARKFQELSGAYNDWSVLRSCFEDEIKRLDSPGSVGLAFEIGRLAAYAEQRKASMKAPMRAALIELQQSLTGLAAAFRLADSGRMATARSGRIRRQPKPQKAIPLASAGTGAA